MKRHFTKIIGATALAASLAILPLNVSAQGQTTDGGAGTTTTTGTTTGGYNDANNNREGFDWGWLGLLGLLGLAGLAGKNRAEEATRYRDPNTVGNTTPTYRE